MLLNKLFLPTLLIFLSLFTACHKKIAPASNPVTQNSKEALKNPYLILISLDGFRWDYLERFQPPNLKNFTAGGVQAASMLPCFPSKTFSNHYTIATGMYPDHHGLVSNSFFDRKKNETYSMGKREIVQDGTWYSGTPIWVQAAKSGMVTASFFFVGSEADVQGIRPTHYYNYDGSIPNVQRVQQVLDWLALPPLERPHFISLYFSDMDDTGHRHGPNNDEKLQTALLALDEVLGQLFDGVAKTGLPVNIIIVSDHGMSPIAVSNLLPIEQVEDDERFRTVNNGALAILYLNDDMDGEAVYRDLKAAEKNYTVYRTKEVPFFETPPDNPRWGDFIVVPGPGHYFVNSRVMGFRKSSGQTEIGEHGFDADSQDMHGIFFANGPALKTGQAIPSFKNIHVYPLMCKILGLDVPKNVDGKLEILQGILEGH